MKDLHQIQRRILYDLLFTENAKFSDIKPVDIENSQFMFHVKSLIEIGIIEKTDNIYKLTTKGKEFANRMTSETTTFDKAVKATTVLVAVKENKDGDRELLLYKRLKNPFYGCVGFPTEKPKWGESLAEAAQRGLMEETNLYALPTLFSIKHYVVNQNDEIVEDKLMHAFSFQDPKGELIGNNEGEYFWIVESEIKKDAFKYLEEFWDFFETYKNFKGGLTFSEYKIVTEIF
jgi:ADP-ribose pyrophosphatase YjhB (NUDIX family)/predicted transcriptional regulator